MKSPAAGDKTPRVVLLESSDMGAWDAFVDESSEQSPFSKVAWLEAFSSLSPRNSFSVVAVLGASGRIDAGITLLKRRTPLGIQNCIVPVMHPQSSLLFRMPETSELDRIYRFRHSCTQAIVERLNGMGFASIRFVHHPGVQDVRPFIWKGWTTCPAYSFQINLSDYKGASSLNHSNRKLFRKCQEEGWTLTVERDPAPLLDTMRKLVCETYQRQGLNPVLHGADAIIAYKDALKAGNAVWFHASRGKEEPAYAQIMVLSRDGTAYGWIAGISTEHFRSGVTTFAIAKALDWLKASGVKTFDFAGANTPKIAAFKQGFNGTLIHGFETYRSSRKLHHRIVRAGGSCFHRMRVLLAR